MGGGAWWGGFGFRFLFQLVTTHKLLSLMFALMLCMFYLHETRCFSFISFCDFLPLILFF